MIDNFKKIKSLLTFESEDDFYFSQILKRKKEHPDLGSNSYVVKTYYIKSLDDLEFYKEEMIVLAKFHNARVGINLNRRSFEKTAFNTLKKVTDQIMNKDWNSVRKSYSSVCGSINNEKEKKWIIDVDFKDPAFNKELWKRLTALEPLGDKYISEIETKNGYHLISKPFNRMEFNYLMNQWVLIQRPDIQTDNPTIMYIP